MTDIEKLSYKFKRWRRDKELSLRETEKLTGVPFATLHRLEKGKQISYSTGKSIERLIGIGALANLRAVLNKNETKGEI